MRIIFILGLLVAHSVAAQTRSYDASDNLVVTHELGCIQAASLKNVYTPADMAPAIQACSREGRAQDAFQIFFIYTIYGGFDAARVADKTAQGAMSVLNLRIFHSMNDTTRDAFQEQAIRMGDASDALYAQSCEIATRLGPPDYYPKYMIAHGMNAFNAGAGDGMKTDVDEEALWVDVMERINGCAAYAR